MSIFCENEKDIDFADICSILPFDQIVVRHPKSKWTDARLKKLVKNIKYDLAFDGYETEIDAKSNDEYAYLTC